MLYKITRCISSLFQKRMFSYQILVHRISLLQLSLKVTTSISPPILPAGDLNVGRNSEKRISVKKTETGGETRRTALRRILKLEIHFEVLIHYRPVWSGVSGQVSAGAVRD